MKENGGNRGGRDGGEKVKSGRQKQQRKRDKDGETETERGGDCGGVKELEMDR